VHHAKLKAELDDDEILTIDLDTATLSGAPVAAKRRAQWLRLPAVVEISRLLLHDRGGRQRHLVDDQRESERGGR
jgi:hypothetical protein